MESPEAPSSGGLLQSLSAVVSFLHSEGFLAAEETLLREIEHRYPAPDAVSPRRAAASPASSGSGGAGGGAAAQQQRRRQQFQQVQQEQEQQQEQQQEQEQQHSAAAGTSTLDFQPALAAVHSVTPAESMESAEK